MRTCFVERLYRTGSSSGRAPAAEPENPHHASSAAPGVPERIESCPKGTEPGRARGRCSGSRGPGAQGSIARRARHGPRRAQNEGGVRGVPRKKGPCRAVAPQGRSDHAAGQQISLTTHDSRNTLRCLTTKSLPECPVRAGNSPHRHRRALLHAASLNA